MMKPRNRNPRAKKGPYRVTVHFESYALLERLSLQTGIRPDDVIHLALNCYIAYIATAKSTSSPRMNARARTRHPSTLGSALGSVLANVKEKGPRDDA